MYVLDGRKLRQGRPFTHNGIQYPGNWLDLTTTEEKAAIGITWEADSASFDGRFYYSAEVARPLEDSAADSAGISTTGLKTIWKKDQDTSAHNLLAPTDWYVVRKYETDTAIPVGITSFRTAVRDTCEARKVALDGASDIDEFIGVTTFHGMRWPAQPS